jgi:hypothetical protein
MFYIICTVAPQLVFKIRSMPRFIKIYKIYVPVHLGFHTMFEPSGYTAPVCAHQCCGSGFGIQDPGSGVILPPGSGIGGEFFPDPG